MSATSETVATIESALLQSSSIRRVISLQVAPVGDDLVVGAKIDLDAELTMKEVSTILLQAKRRVQTVVPQAEIIFLEPDVWVDPDAVPPTTSSIVMLGLD